MAKQLKARRPTERDVIVRALAWTLTKHERVSVEYPGGDDDCAPYGDMPDVVLRHPRSQRLLRVLVIETRCSLTRPRSELWQLFASFAPLTLVVPKGAAREAERLLWRTDARIVEYERAKDGEVKFRPLL